MQARPDRSLLVTADAGTKPSLLVFWDPVAGQPVATVQEPHAAGVLSMAISADGRQLATLSALAAAQDDQGAVQQVRVWPWHADMQCSQAGKSAIHVHVPFSELS